MHRNLTFSVLSDLHDEAFLRTEKDKSGTDYPNMSHCFLHEYFLPGEAMILEHTIKYHKTNRNRGIQRQAR